MGEKIDLKETLVILIRKTLRRKGLGIHRKQRRMKRVIWPRGVALVGKIKFSLQHYSGVVCLFEA